MPISKASRAAIDARRPIKERSKTQAAAAPTQQSLYETSDVHERIARWQEAGTTTLKDPDNASLYSRPRSALCRTPSQGRAESHAAREESRTTPRRRSAKWVQQEDSSWTQRRRSARPEEGRDLVTRPRSSSRKASPPRDCPTPNTFTHTESLRTRNYNSSRAEREERRKRRREARANAEVDRRPFDDGIRVYPDPESGPRSELTESVSPPEDSLRVTIVGRKKSNLLDAERTDECLTFVEEDAPKKPSKYAQALRDAAALKQDPLLGKTRKRDILHKTKDILAGNLEVPLESTNRIPSIQAWLYEQPDPFVENHSPDKFENTTTRMQETAPQQVRSRRTRTRREQRQMADPNQIWEAVTATRNDQHEARAIRSQNSSPREHRPSSKHGESKTSTSNRRLFSFELADENKPSKAKSFSDQPPRNVTVDKEPALLTRNTKDHSSDVVGSGDHLTGSPAQGSISVSTPKLAASARAPLKKSRLARDLPKVPEHEEALPISTPVEPEIASTRTSGALKRKLTSHEDLLSVLSQPRTRRSTRSIRNLALQDDLGSAKIIEEVFQIMRAEEPKYLRELKTLVDGVTPVLLQSLLSKTNVATTIGLFQEDGEPQTHMTKPIINMGVALEKLKNAHTRVPLQNNDHGVLLTWAQAAHRSYVDYVKSWRLGFQGLIVELAPLDPSRMTQEEELARSIDDAVIDAENRKVDVSYLQKRPLIRIKKLAKLFATIKEALPGNQKAEQVAILYSELTETARQKHSDEQGRLEDEAACAIDTTKARELRTLAPISHELVIERKRKVRARDFFDLTLYHSSGQRMDCKVEIILRDDPTPDGVGGDILICQIDKEDKWLLFPPILLSHVSARRDEKDVDLVMMIRGTAGIGQSWSELLALKAEAADAVVEWMHMVGSSPLPPKLNRRSVFIESQPVVPDNGLPASADLPRPTLNISSLAQIPAEVDIPLGEPSVIGRRRRSRKQPEIVPVKKGFIERTLPKLSLGGGLQKRELKDDVKHNLKIASQRYEVPSIPAAHPFTSSENSRKSHSHTSSVPSLSTTTSLINPSQLSSAYSSQSVHKFQPASTISATTQSSRTTYSIGTDLDPTSHINKARPRTPLEIARDNRHDAMHRAPVNVGGIPQRPKTPTSPTGQSPSNVHFVHRTRRSGLESGSASTSLTEAIREQWQTLVNAQQRRPLSLPVTSTEEIVPLPPPHRSSIATASSLPSSPFATPAPIRSSLERQNPENTFSLRQQYRLSTSSSGSGFDQDTDATSDDEDDVVPQPKLEPQALIASQHIQEISASSQTSRPLSAVQPVDQRSPATPRRSPSVGRQSSSSPTVPLAAKKRTAIATVCSWSDRGIWEPIRDDECSIIVLPGLVQVRPINEAYHGNQHDLGPLVEFELTPIVPLRKGTALDITIRSTPTTNSTLQTTNNVMFRSHTVQECEKLYQMINWGRCNNPVYAQLARDRARQPQKVTFATDVQPAKSRSWFSFGAREKNSYRASSRAPASLADTGISSASSGSAYAALRRFGKNSPFSLQRSSVLKKNGSFAQDVNSLYSSGNETGSGSGRSTPAASQKGFIPGKAGPNVPQTSAEAVGGGGMVNNMKIRLFIRKGAKWDAIGPCLLTVLPAVVHGTATGSRPSSPVVVPFNEPEGASGATTPTHRPPSAMPSPIYANLTNSRSPSATRSPSHNRTPSHSRAYRLPSSSHTPHRLHNDGREKRILIVSARNRAHVILDEALGESCFEKVMQTGIAVNVWREDQDIRSHGGVVGGKGEIYMIQCTSGVEAGWVFGLVGGLR